MEVPLTPLDFARRARKLYPQREAVVDGGSPFVDAADVSCERLDVRLDSDRDRGYAFMPTQGGSYRDLRANHSRKGHRSVRRADGAHRHREWTAGSAPATSKKCTRNHGRCGAR